MGKVLILIIAALILAMLNPTISKEFLQTDNQIYLPAPQPINPQKFNYPNSKVISSNDGILILESDDSATTITGWYKNQIKNMDMKATSFVQTNTNGEVLNKLVGASSSKKVNIEIKKGSDQSKTRITVNTAFK